MAPPQGTRREGRLDPNLLRRSNLTVSGKMCLSVAAR